MAPIDYLYLVLFPTMLAAGQFFFKRTSDALTVESLPRFITSLLASPWFWAALFIYGAATLLWVFILSRVPLSRAMPFVALAFVIVPIISAVFLGERLNLTYWIGVAVIVTGVAITVTALSAQ